MKKILLIVLFGLTMLVGCVPAHSQNVLYATLGEDKNVDVASLTIASEASIAIKEILCTNVWKPTNGMAKLTFGADNDYRMTIPRMNSKDKDYYVDGKWLISPTVLTIVIDEKYIEHYTIVSINKKLITLLGYNNCPIYLKSQ